MFRRSWWSGPVLCGLALAWAEPSRGQPVSLTSPPPRFQRFSSDNGLPQSSVRVVLQTPDGFLWATTFDGLVRFDGVSFKVLDAGNTPGLSGNRFVTLHADADGTLWVADESKRIFRIKDGAAKACNEPETLPKFPAFARDRSGRLLAFSGPQVLEVRDGSLHPVTDLPHGNELTAAVPLPGAWPAWMAERSALIVEDGELRQVAFPAEALGGGPAGASSVFSMSPSADGGLYVVSWDGSIRRHQRGRWERLPSLAEMTAGALKVPLLTPGQPSPEAWPMLRDRAGRLWLAVTRHGLMRRDPSGSVVRYDVRDGFSYGRAAPYLFEDAAGGIWVGTDVGLLRFKGDLVTTLSTFDGLPTDNIYPVLEDRTGVLWVGAGSGAPLTRVTSTGIERISHPALDGSSTVQSALLEDSSGRILIATGNRRLVAHRDGRFEEISDLGPLAETVVTAMHEDADGGIWFGGEGQLVRLARDGSWKTLGTAEGLPSTRVRAFHAARGGGLWVGTWGGLALLKDGAITSWREKDGLSSDHIRSLFEEEDGTLWIGTYDRGLTRFKDGRFARVTAAEGLPANGVFAILPDDAGRLWMSSNLGVMSVARSELHAGADRRTARVSAVLYTREDGMLSSECNGGRQPAGFRRRDGRLLFGSQGGIVQVDPAAQPPSSVAPRVFLEAVLSRGAPLPLGASLDIRPDQDDFEIRYTSPSFVKPELIRFEYRLAGLGGLASSRPGEEWSDAGTRRSAFFSYVPPGKYTFEVRATSVDGVVSAPARLPVAVFAPWWRTRTALASTALLLVGLATLGVRMRIRSLRHRGRELEALVASRTDELAAKARQLEHAVDRLTVSEREAQQASQAKSVFLASMSHELRTPLNAVLGFAQLMERRPGRTADDRESLDIIRRSGEHLLGLIEDVLSLAKIEAGKATLAEAPFALHRLLHSVRDMVRVRTHAKGLRLEFQLDPAVPAFALGDEGKLRQVLLNLLGNAVKFTQSGSVTLRVARREGKVRFEVRDTGEGISAAELGTLFGAFAQTASGRKAAEGTGLGLAISRSLVRLMGGDIEVASEAGKGSTFAFELPLAECAAPAEAVERRSFGRLAEGQKAFRVLVADDVAENRLLLSKLLWSAGFQVAEASDGTAALAALRDQRPDLALLDVRMPGLDGREVTRLVRSDEAGGEDRCRIVGLSAGVLAEERQAFLDAGGDAFLGKPFREAAVFELLESLLGARFESAPAPSPASAAVTLDGLPAETLERLEAALTDGDLDRARTVAEEMRQSHPGQVAAVTLLLDGFEVGRLLTMVEERRR